MLMCFIRGFVHYDTVLGSIDNGAGIGGLVGWVCVFVI